MAEEERQIQRRKRPDELTKAIRLLDKSVQTAVDTLTKLCKDPDPKIRLDASKSLLNVFRDMKDQEDKRALQKVLVAMKQGNIKFAEDDDTPEVCFDTIQTIE